MQELVRDPIWQFLAALIAVISLAAFIITSRRPRLGIAFEVLSRTPIPPPHQVPKDRIKLFDGKKPIRDGHLITVRLTNVGTVPLLARAFVEPLSIVFGPSSKVVSASKTESAPHDLDLTISHTASKATFVFPLLNPRETFTVSLLLSGAVDPFEVKARAPSLPPPRRLRRTLLTPHVLLVSILAIGWALFFIRLLTFPQSTSQGEPLDFLDWLGVTGIFMAMSASVFIIIRTASDLLGQAVRRAIDST